MESFLRADLFFVALFCGKTHERESCGAKSSLPFSTAQCQRYVQIAARGWVLHILNATAMLKSRQERESATFECSDVLEEGF